MTKKILNVKIYFGTEQTLRYYTIFDKLLKNGIFDTINVSLDKAVLFRVRDGFSNLEEFYEDCLIVMRWIFRNPNINVVYDQSFELTHFNRLVEQYGHRMSYYVNENLIDESMGNELNLPDKYITISTKIWGSLHGVYDQHKMRILETLNRYNHKILILGERSIVPCGEYVNVATRSIYKDLIEGLKNYEDYAYNDSSENSDLEKLKKSFYILNKSHLNVFITDSGMRITNLFLNKNVIGLTNYGNFTHSDIVDFNPEITHITNDVASFIDRLRVVIEKLNA